MKTDNIELYYKEVSQKILNSFSNTEIRMAGLNLKEVENMISSKRNEHGELEPAFSLFTKTIDQYYENGDDTDIAVSELQPICHQLVNAQLSVM